ncbi:amidohydrolase [Gemmatimonadota bacterium]
MKRILNWGMVILMLAGLSDCASGPEPADLVLINGNIYPGQAVRIRVGGVAVHGDRVTKVGMNAEVEPYIGRKTEVIDLEGKTVLPGLIDAHGHYMSLGESLMQLDLRPQRTWEELVADVARVAEEAGPGEWIVGRGWHQEKWDRPPEPAVEGQPVHASLSVVTPDNPVMLIHVSGHGVFINRAALERLGINDDTPDPDGGTIVRDRDGHATGMLRETAQDLARNAVADWRAERPPEVIEAEFRRQVELAGQEALANGITTFHDMGETFATIDMLKVMADEGNLPVRLYVHVQEPADVLAEHLADYRMIGYGNNFLTVRAIGEKVLDGALGTHGGWLLEPYADMSTSTGFNVTPIEDIRASALLAEEHGFQMAIQGIGDRATRELLDIYEPIIHRQPGQSDLRWRIEHCQVIHPDDLVRFPDLHVYFSIRGIFATSDGPWVVDRLGEVRTRERGYQYRRMFEVGGMVINGTDPPVEDIANFHATVTRFMPDGTVFQPEQRLTREQALMTCTVNPAFAGFEENLKGTLKVGKLADLTILSQDIMTVPEDRILDSVVVFTIIGGEVRYRRR